MKDRQNVESSTIVSIGYESAKRVLEIEFKTGVYQYFHVPKTIFQRLMAASSKGGYFSVFVRDRFEYRKVS